MDPADLVASFSTGTYTVKRRTLHTTSKGRPVDGTLSSFTITASVQPASGTDLQRLPEGQRVNETRKLYTSTMLQAGGVGATYEADLVTVDGEDWQVENVETWTATPNASVGYVAMLQRPVR